MGQRLFINGNVCYYCFEEQITTLRSPKSSVCASVDSLFMDNNLFTYVGLFHDIVSSSQVEWRMIYLHLLVFSRV